MELTEKGLQRREAWLEKNYRLPEFDRASMIERTFENPEWVHFGLGNIFRAFHCAISQKLLDSKKMSTGIIAAEGYDYELVEKLSRPHDDYSVLMTLKSDGCVDKTVIGSIASSFCLDSENERDFEALKSIFRKSSLKLATFTITEKGYNLKRADGAYLPDVEYDMKNGYVKPRSYMGKVVSLLYERFAAGKGKIAMVSTDNCSHNGDKLKAAVCGIAEAWLQSGIAEKEFVEYLNNPDYVSFPWTMIDKITPRPDASVKEILRNDGAEGMEEIVTSKKTFAAPFVNAEESEYLIVENAFPNGCPPLGDAGVILTERETVDKVEKMKVCTCLNPLHTALAVFGCLLGYTLISDEMKNPLLKKLVYKIGYDEGLPVVTDPGIISPTEFLKTVLEKRIPNPFMPDTPQRIATDTSQKLSVRYGETVKAYMASDSLDVHSLKFIPLVFAAWIRYVMGIDDSGKEFELSPDPMIPEVKKYIENVHLGDKLQSLDLEGLYRNASIFGTDLFEAGLADTVTDYFNELNASVGAVASTLKKYLS